MLRIIVLSQWDVKRLQFKTWMMSLWLYTHLSLHFESVSHFVSSNKVWTLHVKIVQACEIFENHDFICNEFKPSIYKLQWLVNIQPINLDSNSVQILNAYSVRSIFGNLRPNIQWASYKPWSFYMLFWIWIGPSKAAAN